MFYIVETEQQLQQLQALCYNDIFIQIITANNNYHSKLTYVVGVYIKPIELDGYFISINHEEGFNLPLNRVVDVLDSFQTKYVIDRKAMLYQFNLSNVQDILLKYSLTYHQQLEYQVQDNTVDWFYNNHPAKHDINAVIPISILTRYCEKTYHQVKAAINLQQPSGYQFFNHTATNVFYLIEQNGIQVDSSKFKQVFNPINSNYNLHNSTIYTKYNLNNATTRPTNAFNSINFAALPKKYQYREVFKPNNNYLVEYDFDGYHIRLLSQIVGYQINEQSAHTHLAKKIFNKHQITEKEYQKAKQINFHAIYGFVTKKYQNVKFFKMITQYIDYLWKLYNQQGYVQNPISGFRLSSNLQDTSPTKLMNYMMQSLETANNVVILKQLLRYLDNKKTSIALYTYDAFILDFHKSDGKQTLIEIKQIIEQQGKYPVKFKYNTSLAL